MSFWSRLWRRDERAPRAQAAVATRDAIFGHRFRNPGLLNEALTHRSHANSTNSAVTYERLEFLGDSVLGLVVARALFLRHPKYSEGELTKAKASLVNVKTLTKVARREHLGDYIHLSPEEDRAGGRQRSSILADVLEAVIGAVYLDGGIEAAEDLIQQLILDHFDSHDTRLMNVNFKGDLLEYLQGQGQGLPRYEVVNETGPDHEKVFTVAVHTNGRVVGHGVGTNKKDAEQQAAREALSVLRREQREPSHSSA
jgi:ribonuclease-3